MEEIKINSSIVELENLKDSTVWGDIVRELESWVEGFKRELRAIPEEAASSNPSTASVLLHMGSCSGRIKAVEYMLSLPDVLISIKEDNKSNKED